MDGYVVEVKRSARRRSPRAAEHVAEDGPRRRFPDKEAARRWADGQPGVRVQDAAPNDPAPVDGYLVADPLARRSGGSATRATTFCEFHAPARGDDGARGHR